MNSVRQLVNIHNLKLSTNFSQEIFLDLILSSNMSIIDSHLNHKIIKQAIGLNEYNYLKENRVFIYSPINKPLKDTVLNERSYLLKYIAKIELFCRASWLIKDNAIHSGLGHLIAFHNNSLLVHSNLLYNAYTNSLGQFDLVTLDASQIDQIIKLMQLVYTLCSEEKNETPTLSSINSGSSRISKAFYFLQSARNSDDLGIKIAHYCVVLESLFSTSQSEIKHRLSETIALFATSASKEQQEIYNTIQTSYNIRSSILHGNGVPSKNLQSGDNHLQMISIKTDEILRKCLNIILSSSNVLNIFLSKSNKEIQDFHLSLLFK